MDKYFNINKLIILYLKINIFFYLYIMTDKALQALRIVLDVQEVNTINELTIENKELTIENKVLKNSIENLMKKLICIQNKAEDLYHWRGENTLDNILKNNTKDYLKEVYGENYKIQFQQAKDKQMENFNEEELEGLLELLPS